MMKSQIHVVVGGRVVKSPIPATGHGRGEGGDVTDTCYMSLQSHGRREGGEITNTCYMSLQSYGRREGDEITDTCYRSW